MFFKKKCVDCAAKDREITQLRHQNSLLNSELAKIQFKLTEISQSDVSKPDDMIIADIPASSKELHTDTLGQSAPMNPTEDQQASAREQLVTDNRKRSDMLRHKYSHLLTTDQDNVSSTEVADTSIWLEARKARFPTWIPATKHDYTDTLLDQQEGGSYEAELQQLEDARRLRLETDRQKAQTERDSADRKALRTKRSENISSAVEQHYSSLKRNFNKSYRKNDYGGVELDERKEEFIKFLVSTGFEVEDQNSSGAANRNSPLFVPLDQLSSELNRLKERIRLDGIKSDSIGFTPSSIPTDGLEFEYWVAKSLEMFGWQANVSKGSGDQGVDVVAELDGTSVGIQCKLYAGSVGNKAVQEVISGIAHYGLDRAVVISNATYSKSAYDLASSTNVLLLSHRDIPDLASILKDPSR